MRSACLALVGVLELAACGTPRRTIALRADAWPTASFASVGLDSAPLLTFAADVSAGRFGPHDRLIVVKDGKLIRDWRFPTDYTSLATGKRSHIGCGPGDCTGFTSAPSYNYFDPATHPFWQGRDVHALQSVTKSVMATLIGIALYRGLIPSTDVPFLSLLRGHDVSQVDARLRTASLHDLLTMRSGIEWHEQDRPLGPTNTTVQLEAADDWVAFTLAQPMDAAPGTKWAYNSGGSHLLSAIIRSVSGMPTERFAERYLFDPLGITDYHWKTPGGIADGEGGLYLRGDDLARIGQLILQDGMWNGERLLPEGYVARATAPIVSRVNAAGSSYGYQWWRVDRGETPIIAALGFGGQRMFLFPRTNTIVVILGWGVYGDRFPDVQRPLLDAALAAQR